MQVKINVTKSLQRYRAMIDRASDLRPVLRVVARDAVNSVQKNFDAEGRPEKWAPLKESSMESKAKNLGGGGHSIKNPDGSDNDYYKKLKEGNKILTDKSTLRNSVTTDVEKTRADIGPGRLPYARIHQKGFSGKNKKGIKMNMPARPYCMMTEQEAKDVKRRMRDYITRGKLS